MPVTPRLAPSILGRGTWAEARRVAEVLRKETVGGVLLLAGTVIALCWANSPWSAGYRAMLDWTVGPAALHLNLSLASWAADGLLAIFFFVAGLELKREFVAGDLRDPRRAAVPVAAVAGGVIVPAIVYTVVNLGGAVRGWAIPTATDIAFALAVLAVIGRCLPSALRTFLLTLAVVDDLLAIVIIAVFYTAHLSVLPLLAALVPLGLFAVLVQRRVRSWWLLLPFSPPGRWCTRPGCTPRSPGCCSGSRCRCWCRSARPDPIPGSPSTSSTGSGRSPPGWRCPSSP